MASLMLRVFSNSLENINTKCPTFYTHVRHSSKLPKRKPCRGTIKHRNIIQSACDSLAAKGFLRSHKPYTPKDNVTESVTAICQQVLGTNYDFESALSREDKFHLLNTCFKELNHCPPNSLLHKIVTANDVIEFYEQPVKTTTPFDELKNLDLPPNLHVQYDYVRFNPQTDTKFKGISAFPNSSTIISSLKAKGKYKGFEAPSPYPGPEVVFKKIKPFE